MNWRNRATRPRLSLEALETRETPAVVGGLDPSFNTDGTGIYDPGGNDFGNAVALDSLGRIIVVGDDRTGNGGSDFEIIRLTPSGALDLTFSGDGLQTVDFADGSDSALGVAIDANDNIIVVGQSTTAGVSQVAVAKLTSAGALDGGFTGGGKLLFTFATGTNSGASDAVIDAAGGLVVVGASTGTGAGALSQFGVARLTSGGAFDGGFTGGGKTAFSVVAANNDTANAVTLDAAGRIVIVGNTITTPPVVVSSFAVARLTATGAFDGGFVGGGKTTVSFPPDPPLTTTSDRAFAVDTDAANSVYIAGSHAGTGTRFGVAKLTSGGLPDATFGTAGLFVTDFGGATQSAKGIEVMPSGRVVVTGNTSANGGDFAATQLLPNGTIDTGFDSTGTTPGKIVFDLGAAQADAAFGTVIDNDGRIVMIGSNVTTFGIEVARLIGTVEKGRHLLVGGATDGTAVAFASDQPTGQYNTSPVFGGSLIAAFFTGSVRVAVGDVNGDGIEDRIGLTGPGAPIRFSVISGKDGATVLVPPTAPFAGSESFTGGGFVSSADLDHDGRAEIIVTPDQGGGPRVTIFSRNSDGSLEVRGNFFGIDDAGFRGGCRAALGDVNGDGVPDIAVAAGFLGGPRIGLFNGKTLFTTPTRLVNDFFAFPGTDAVTLRNGSFVAVGDVNGDGFADLIFGGGPGGAPRVYILSGQTVNSGAIQTAYDNPVANFFVAGNFTDRGGVRVASKDADGDRKAELAVGSGEGSQANVRAYLGKNFTTAAEPGTFQDIPVFGGSILAGGVFVG